MVFRPGSLLLIPVVAGRHTPTQFVYDAKVASSVEKHGNCTVTSWDGMDPFGITAPPWVSYVDCPHGGEFHAAGVADNEFQVWLHKGSLSVNGKTHRRLGESFWVANGALSEIRVAGSAYIVGGKFRLGAGEEAVFTSSFLGPKVRSYDLDDAVASQNEAFLGHDDHICNGTSPSMDFVFGSQTTVDPASVVVLNCADGSSPESNFVWSHFHPFGAVYLPFSGNICYDTAETVCTSPGTARWTSPNLQYYEHFQKINETNQMADDVRALAGVSEGDCEHPIVFAVTNFDVATHAGVPNFDDWPKNAHSNDLLFGKAPWGVFPRMAVQNTRVAAVSSVVADHREVLV